MDLALNSPDIIRFIRDRSKWIDGDIGWAPDNNNNPAARVFRRRILHNGDNLTFVVARFNYMASKLTYCIFHPTAGRIYGLDIGVMHRNPNLKVVGRIHKHSWNPRDRDKYAYVPSDITATWDQPIRAWREFCDEAGIQHYGELDSPSVQTALP